MTNKGLGAIKSRDAWMVLVKQAAEDYTQTTWQKDGGYIVEEEKGYLINVYDYLDDYAESFVYDYLDEYVGSLIEDEKRRLKED